MFAIDEVVGNLGVFLVSSTEVSIWLIRAFYIAAIC